MPQSRLPEKWRRRARIAASFVINSIHFASAVASLIVFLAGLGIWNWAASNPRWPLSIGAFILGIIATIAYFFISFLIAPPYRWILKGYRCLSAEYLLQIEDSNLETISQTTTIKIQALQNGIDLFELRYRWTGDDNNNQLQVLSKGHRPLGQPQHRDDWMFYFIYFEKHLDRGDHTIIEVKQILNNTNRKFKPRLTKKVTEPLDKLVLRVKLPEKCNPINIEYKNEHLQEHTSRSVQVISGTIDAAREIRWEINHIENEHIYGIYWEWEM